MALEIIYLVWIIANIINIEQVTLNIHQYSLPEAAICVFYKWIQQIKNFTGQKHALLFFLFFWFMIQDFVWNLGSLLKTVRTSTEPLITSFSLIHKNDPDKVVSYAKT